MDSLLQDFPRRVGRVFLALNDLGGNMRKAYFKIFQDRAGEWRWTLYAANHEAVATSEGYSRRASAEAMANKLWQIAYEAVK